MEKPKFIIIFGGPFARLTTDRYWIFKKEDYERDGLDNAEEVAASYGWQGDGFIITDYGREVLKYL